MAARFVKINVFCLHTGYTEKAVRRKIESGAWAEGKEYRKAPDGHIMIDWDGYNKWVQRSSAVPA